MRRNDLTANKRQKKRRTRKHNGVPPVDQQYHPDNSTCFKNVEESREWIVWRDLEDRELIEAIIKGTNLPKKYVHSELANKVIDEHKLQFIIAIVSIIMIDRRAEIIETLNQSGFKGIYRHENLNRQYEVINSEWCIDVHDIQATHDFINALIDLVVQPVPSQLAVKKQSKLFVLQGLWQVTRKIYKKIKSDCLQI